MIDDLAHRFTYYPPNDAKIATHQNIRTLTGDLARQLNEILPDGREKSLAITRLEEVMMWSNAAVARAKYAAIRAT